MQKKLYFISLIFLIVITTIISIGLFNSTKTEALTTKNNSFGTASTAITNSKMQQSVLIKTKVSNFLSKSQKEKVFDKIASLAKTKVDFYLTNFDSFVISVDVNQLDIIKKSPEVTEVKLYKQYQLPEKPIDGSNDNNSIGISAIKDTFDPNTIPNYHKALGIVDNNSRQGMTGNNVNIAIIDTGIDFSYPELTDKSVAEACFSDLNKETNIKSYSLCPNKQNAMIGLGAAKPCQGLGGCEHGSHVAGIAVGKKTNTNHQGIAPDAKIVAINVFHVVENEEKCTPKSRFSDFVTKIKKCIYTSNFAYLKALDFILDQNKKTPITSVNMSLGTNSTRDDNCDDGDTASFHKVIDNGIALIIAAGNGSKKNQMSHPACQSKVISVASYDIGFNSDSFFSNISPKTTYFAPGYQIRSIGMNMSGTSMSAPMVSGATALLKQSNNSMNVRNLQNTLTSTGTRIGNYNAKLINIPQAIKNIGTIPRNNDSNTDPKISTNPCEQNKNGWCASFYNNKELLGTVINTMTFDTLNVRGQTTAPTLNVNPDNFSAVFTTKFKIINTKKADYKFRYNFDDGVRIYLKNSNTKEIIIDKWYNKAPRNEELTKSLANGDYEIIVEYYENKGGATYSLELFDQNNQTIKFAR